eukprot:580610-Pyramimonas_sp.AAC.1
MALPSLANAFVASPAGLRALRLVSPSVRKIQNLHGGPTRTTPRSLTRRASMMSLPRGAYQSPKEWGDLISPHPLGSNLPPSPPSGRGRQSSGRPARSSREEFLAKQAPSKKGAGRRGWRKGDGQEDETKQKRT